MHVALVDAPGLVAEPFCDHQRFLEERLAATRLRLQIASAYAQVHTRDERSAALIAAEMWLEMRLSASRSDAVPLALLGDRLQLSTDERSVLWTLIAHEVCPISRALLRQLNTELVLDPTTDTLRRTVYGPGAGATARGTAQGVAPP